MVAAVAAAPAYTVRFHFHGLPTTLLELVLLAAIGLGLAAFWEEIPWRGPYTVGALLVLAGATLDTWFTPEPVKALGLWKAYFVEPMLAGLVVAAMARSRIRARELLLGLGVGALAPAMANAAVDGTALATHTFNLVTPQVVIYNTANAIPLFLEPLFAFALAIAVHGDHPVERAVAGVLAVFYAAAVVLSFSRLGWITLLAVCLLVAAFHPRRWYVFGATALVAVAALVGSSSVRHRVLVEFQPGSRENTIALRIPLWRSTLSMLAHHPVFGGGLSGFKESLEPYRDPAYHEDLIYPHDLLLNTWSETGILGLAGFVVVLAQALRVALRGLVAESWPRALAIGMLGMLLAIAVHGIGDVPYFKNDQALVFWVLLAVPLGAFQASDSAIPGRP